MHERGSRGRHTAVFRRVAFDSPFGGRLIKSALYAAYSVAASTAEPHWLRVRWPSPFT